MLRIYKGSSPTSFENWKRSNRGKGKRFVDLKGTPKKDLKTALINEQHGLCCYCCASISNELSHIEHIKPKGLKQWRHLELSYSNMLASCMGYVQDGNTCGHNKDEWYEEGLFVSPLDADCEARFNYLANGKIVAASEIDIAAKITIDHLNLNSYELVEARRAIIESVFDNQDIQMNLEKEIVRYRTPNVYGNLESFCNVIAFALNYSISRLR